MIQYNLVQSITNQYILKENDQIILMNSHFTLLFSLFFGINCVFKKNKALRDLTC